MTAPSWPWGPGTATGIGSLPGTDIGEAVKYVLGELPDLPHLPELPDRGPGADLIGRSAAFLTEIAVELYAAQWRIASRPGRDLRRALDFLGRDLDALTVAADGYVGPLKVQAAGPWTLAASIDLVAGGRILRDHGATRDLAASLADGLRSHVDDVARRVPGATVLLQLDEPTLPAALAGRVRSESGLHTLRTVESSVAVGALRSIVDSVGVPVVVHCCAPAAPIGLFRDAGAAALALDLSLLATSQLDALGEAIDAGLGIFAGAVPTTGRAPDAAVVAASVTDIWQKLGFAPARLSEQVVVTPACGLAGATPDGARAALAAAVAAAHRLTDL